MFIDLFSEAAVGDGYGKVEGAGKDGMRAAGEPVRSEAIIPLGVSMVAHWITPIVPGIRPFADRRTIQLTRAAAHRIHLRL